MPAHLERAGPFNPNGNNGFNVEHLRDMNNAAPRVAFGMETQPGHGASDNQGEYTVLRNNFGTGVGQIDSVGGTTYGGTGVYGAQIGGVWDALLGEGRNWWFFASSDWHNRGSFGPDDRRSTQDFYPGEYQRNYTMVRSGADKLRPQTIVDGLRSGNNFATEGQIIDRLGFVVCTGKADGQVAAARRERCGREHVGRRRRRLRHDGREAGGRAGLGHRDRSRGARPGGKELLAVHVREPVAGAGRHHSADQRAGARPHRPDRRLGHRLPDSRHGGLLRRVAAQHQLAARGRHDGRSGRGARRGQEHQHCDAPRRSTAAAARPGKA